VLSALWSGALFSIVSNALSNAAQGAAQATDQVDPNSLQSIQDEARELLAPNGGSLSQASLNVLNRVVRGEVTQEQMQSAASSLAEQAGIPEEQARETLNNWQAQYNQAAEKARQAAQVAAETVSKAALWSFLALVLGAIAGSLGGLAGAPVGWDRY